jgi:hypothetical protein
VNDDDTPGSAQNRPQKVANVISFSALSNMHTQLGHASAGAMLRFLEGGILPAEVISGVSILHHILAFKEAKPNDAMDTEPEVRINAINKEIRGLFNRRAFSVVQVDAVHLHANIIGTCIVTRLKRFGTIDEEAKARLII